MSCKNCFYGLQFKAENGDKICAGFNKKPTKYKKDIIKLCLKGIFDKGHYIEMTVEEALYISSALTGAINKSIEMFHKKR